MDEMDRRLVRELQGSIPSTENPYETLGDRLGISEDEIVERLRALSASGKLKRIGAILRHQKSGFAANAMAVFQVPRDDVPRLGHLLGECPLVSHCYERFSCEEWPFQLYAMLHGGCDEDIEVFVRDFALRHGVERFELLYSEEELKKTSMVYFEESPGENTY